MNQHHKPLPDNRLTSTHLLEGIVFKKTIGNYTVHAGGRVIGCALSSRLRKEFTFSMRESKAQNRKVNKVKINDDVDPVAVGDRVSFVEAEDGNGLIVEVLPRRTWISRQTAVPMPSAKPFEQVIVANMDQVMPVFSAANPVPKWNLLDRYLVSAEAMDLPAVICITKVDLAEGQDGQLDAELQSVVDEYRQIGYPVILASALTGAGLEDVRQALQGRSSVLLGKSGVGKSSLLNALQPGLGLRVNEVSLVTGKGKHTTTHMEMFPLSFGGTVVDTPGIREFGLWDVGEEDLPALFPEMRPFLGRCKFGLDCRHNEEPGCAIRKAVTAGEISPRRYLSLMHLRDDL